MREIKYRAWIEKEKKMVDVSSLYFQGGGWPNSTGQQALYEIDYRKNKHEFVFENNRNVVLMQYTGLKDKNGKDIYEGDLVRFKALYERIGKVVILPPRVELFDGNEYWDIYDDENYEVIGNIHDNPSLLEQS